MSVSNKRLSRERESRKEVSDICNAVRGAIKKGIRRFVSLSGPNGSFGEFPYGNGQYTVKLDYVVTPIMGRKLPDVLPCDFQPVEELMGNKTLVEEKEEVHISTPVNEGKESEPIAKLEDQKVTEKFTKAEKPREQPSPPYFEPIPPEPIPDKDERPSSPMKSLQNYKIESSSPPLPERDLVRPKKKKRRAYRVTSRGIQNAVKNKYREFDKYKQRNNPSPELDEFEYDDKFHVPMKEGRIDLNMNTRKVRAFDEDIVDRGHVNLYNTSVIRLNKGSRYN